MGLSLDSPALPVFGVPIACALLQIVYWVLRAKETKVVRALDWWLAQQLRMTA